jgi:DNA polymerase V
VKGTASVSRATHSDAVWVKEIEALYRKIVHPDAMVRRMNITCNKIEEPDAVQYSLFEDPVEEEQHERLQKTVVGLRKRFGKNAVVKGMNLEDHGTTIERNRQIGGHKSGE